MSTLDVNDCAPQLPTLSHDHSYQLTFEQMIEEHGVGFLNGLLNYYCKFSASYFNSFIFNLKLQVKELTDRIQAMSLKRAFTLEDILGDERKVC